MCERICENIEKEHGVLRSRAIIKQPVAPFEAGKLKTHSHFVSNSVEDLCAQSTQDSFILVRSQFHLIDLTLQHKPWAAQKCSTHHFERDWHFVFDLNG